MYVGTVPTKLEGSDYDDVCWNCSDEAGGKDGGNRLGQCSLEPLDEARGNRLFTMMFVGTIPMKLDTITLYTWVNISHGLTLHTHMLSLGMTDTIEYRLLSV